MTMSKRLALYSCILILLLAVALPNIFAASQTRQNRLLEVSIPAPSLQNNLVGENIQQRCYIYLPPSYEQRNQKKYPVVYFLNGFGDSAQFVHQFRSFLDEQFLAGKLPEMIVVGVNGINKLGGSFYANSPVTGNWEDFVVSDVVHYMDANFRTIAQPSSRGLAGFSMGGYGAINLGFKHPDIFAVVYSTAPGLMNPTGLKKALQQWDLSFNYAYGAVFAPTAAKQSPYTEIPTLDGTATDNVIVTKWENGYGNLPAKVADYQKKPNRLTAIKIQYGIYDEYEWIPEGCRYLSELLTAAKIEHELKPFNGGHNFNNSLWQNEMFPFFAANLKTE